jgi:hypothetical protein
MVTATQTNEAICRDALRKIGVVAVDETPTADEIETARRALERLLKAWQNRGYLLWSVTSMSVTLTTASSYSLTPARPVQIQNVNFRRSAIDLPMIELTRQEYDRLPNKATKGTPTQYYYDRQRDAGTLYIWPSLATAAGETLEVTYVRELADVQLSDPVDVPSEWWDAAVYNLALRLMPDFGVSASALGQDIIAMAGVTLQDALSGDREGSVYFVGEDWAV